MAIAELHNVHMTYGSTEVLHDVSYSIGAGEAVALLGPNGAGKTTSLKLLTGLKKVQKGRATLFGSDPRVANVRRSIGVTPQDLSFPHAQKVGELMAFAQSHYPSPTARRALLDAFDLTDHAHRTASELSGGQQRRVAVALAFCGNPKAVFLDEPTTGLDGQCRQKLWDYILQFKANVGAIFLTTHYLEEAERIADRVVLLDQGRIIRAGTVDEIKKAVDVRIVRFSSGTDNISLSSARLASTEGAWRTFLSYDADDTVRALVNSNIAFEDLEVLPASLEEAVSELLKDAA